MAVPVSATLAADEALNRRREAGERVVPTAFGQAGIPVHPELLAELSANASRNAYGPVAGLPRLREAAAGYLARRGVPTDPGRVIAGPGSKPLLYAILLALGGDVVVPKPSWVSYAAQAALIGVRARSVPTRPGQGGVPDPDVFAEVIARARAEGRPISAVILTLPDNPTGTLASSETVRAVCETAREHDVLIVSDEIYRDLVFDPDPDYRYPAELAPEHTVVTTGLSKNLALGGWRIGVARLPDGPLGARLHEPLSSVASEVWSSPAQPVQLAAAYAFDEPAALTEYVAKARSLYGRITRAVADRFGAAGASVRPPVAAFYCYPDLGSGELADRLPARTGPELAELLVERYGVGVLPASAFGEGREALRFRVATGMLTGSDTEQQSAALNAADPLSLPWIGASLDRLSEVLAELAG
ncbi:MAG: aminotransferase class I/II-fold pyridoxal phosphate-dependent enzyme [Pseudonocardiaceae bacterium]|nr:aminotransferase class I/II-fold pyridoxal phosphate-dependent enzyme [Pseudonocardiaceae bacterium]